MTAVGVTSKAPFPSGGHLCSTLLAASGFVLPWGPLVPSGSPFLGVRWAALRCAMGGEEVGRELNITRGPAEVQAAEPRSSLAPGPGLGAFRGRPALVPASRGWALPGQGGDGAGTAAARLGSGWVIAWAVESPSLEIFKTCLIQVFVSASLTSLGKAATRQRFAAGSVGAAPIASVVLEPVGRACGTRAPSRRDCGLHRCCRQRGLRLPATFPVSLPPALAPCPVCEGT